MDEGGNVEIAYFGLLLWVHRTGGRRAPSHDSRAASLADGRVPGLAAHVH